MESSRRKHGFLRAGGKGATDVGVFAQEPARESSRGRRDSGKFQRFVSLIGKSLVNLSEEGAMAALEPGAKAPDFTLTAAMPDGSEQLVSLPGLAGGWVAVFVYPKDSTSG